jgi:hypothetical protein
MNSAYQVRAIVVYEEAKKEANVDGDNLRPMDLSNDEEVMSFPYKEIEIS